MSPRRQIAVASKPGDRTSSTLQAHDQREGDDHVRRGGTSRSPSSARTMIESECGRIDYDEIGDGPTVVLVPGSCSTGAAWRPFVSHWDNSYRCATTSLLGYGGAAGRRAVDG